MRSHAPHPFGPRRTEAGGARDERVDDRPALANSAVCRIRRFDPDYIGPAGMLAVMNDLVDNVMYLNRRLRRLGLKPRLLGENEGIDRVKSVVVRAHYRATRWRKW